MSFLTLESFSSQVSADLFERTLGPRPMLGTGQEDEGGARKKADSLAALKRRTSLSAALALAEEKLLAAEASVKQLRSEIEAVESLGRG